MTMAGDDPVLGALTAEFAPLETSIEGSPHLAFEFGPDLPKLDDYVVLSPLSIGRDAYVARYGGLEYHVAGELPNLRVHVRSLSGFRPERVTPSWLLRAANRNYLLPSEKVAKNFMYNVFDYLSQLANLRLGQTYLHASSFERDGRAVAIAAWGGVGKTTSMLKLVGEAGWRFLSDDLGLIDESRTAWRTPKRMQIYGYNLEGQPVLRERLMSGRSPLDRAAFGLVNRTAGPKRVRRRVSAEELFGPERIARSGRLDDVIGMERASVPDIVVETIEPDELARRAASTMVREVQPLADLIAAMHSGGSRPILPTHAEFFDTTRAMLRACLDGVRCRMVRVPLRSDPDALADRLTRILDEV